MKIKLNLNIFLFLSIFLITKQIKIYCMLMLFAFIHELSHLIAGILLGFKLEAFRIMPFGFSIEFKTEPQNYNKKVVKSNILAVKKIIIALAGPLLNIIIAIIGILHNMDENIIYSNILLMFFNLIPIYPLDGGRILKNLLKIFLGNKKATIYTNKISNIFIIILTIISSILIIEYKNVAILFIIGLLWYLVMMENKRYNLANKIYKTIDNQRNYL